MFGSPWIPFCAFALLLLNACSSSPYLCDGRVVIHSEEGISFTKNEEPLLCGDKELKPWNEVPLSQTEASLKEFLRGRGYYDVSFKLQDKQLHVTTGLLHKVQKVVFVGAPEAFNDVRFEGWRDQDFTSATLDDIERWTVRRLKTIGYACAQVKLQAVIKSRLVEVKITPGKHFEFPELEYDNTIRPDVLERFYAFKPGQPFNQDLLALSSRRIEGDGVVTRSNFITQCSKDQLKIKHAVNIGTSNLLRVGAGASTEEIPIFKFGWKNSRIGEGASILSTDLYASHIRQVAQIGYEWHIFEANRWFLMPTFTGKRVNEDDQKYHNFLLHLPVGTALDYKLLRFELQSGPAGVYEYAQEGPTRGRKDFGIWKSKFSTTSHDFEVFMNDPQKGFHVTLETSSVAFTSVEPVSAHWINLNGSKLWNLWNFDPAHYIFGVRWGMETVLGSGPVRENIPQDFFTWLGGDSSLRGFGRRELPTQTIGALSSAFLGTEFRFASLVMEGLDPFVFIDFGILGTENFSFQKPLFYSPGFGMRWQSPIGAVRATLAHGYVAMDTFSDNEHLQAFLSLGREF